MDVTTEDPTDIDASRPPKLKKSTKKANTKSKAHYDEVNVLVTGFGAIDHVNNPNPSWRVAKRLPPALPANAAHPTRIRISVHPEPIESTYAAVLCATPKLFDGPNPIHLVLHLGAAVDDRKHYSIEHTANKAGYASSDDDGKNVQLSSEPTYWQECDSTMESTAGLVDVLKRWQSSVELANVDLRTSEHAGNGLVEYQFYASLARVMHVGNGLAWQERTLVSCMIMPNDTSEEALERGKDVVISLIYALIDSRRYRDGDYDELPDGQMGAGDGGST